MFGNTSLFVDHEKFNCSVCDTSNVVFDIVSAKDVNWSKKVINYVYIIKCTKCGYRTMHFSKFDLPLTKRVELFGYGDAYTSFNHVRFSDEVQSELQKNGFDSLFFFSVPRGKFEVDDSIPLVLRKIFFEAVDCYRANLLTGASACIRKVIYELLVDKNILPDKNLKHYNECIDKLQTNNTSVNSEYFLILKSITGITSDQIHELAWQKMESHHIDLILNVIKIILYELYAVPEIRKKHFESLQNLKKQVEGNNKKDYK